jgi:hypothetical protein
MSSTGMPVFDLPAKRELPTDRRDAIRRLLEDTAAGERPVRRRPRMRRVLWPTAGLVAASAIAAAALVVGDFGSAGDEAATASAVPPVLAVELSTGVPAGAELRELASLAAAGEVQQYAAAEPTVSTESWNMVVSQFQVPPSIPDGFPEGAAAEVLATDGGSGVSTYVVPVLRDLRFLPDGSVHVRETQGSPRFTTAEPEAADLAIAGTVLVDETYPPGTRMSSHPAELDTRPEALREQLLAASPQATDHAAALFRALYEVLSNQPVDAPVRAAALTMLANEPGVVALGETTDRRGRDVVAFATDSDDTGGETRYVLLVDPATGRFLGYEEVLLGDGRRIGVESPAIISYTAFL